MTKPLVKGEMLRWARKRARLTHGELAKGFKNLPQWENEDKNPTFVQLENFAKKVHVPFGYLFLNEPPDEKLPIRDFRTISGEVIAKPSVDLIDTVYISEQRQYWYRNYCSQTELPKLTFVGSKTVADPPLEVAQEISKELDYGIAERRKNKNTVDEALGFFIKQAENARILVMINSIVQSNTHRRLDTNEFRGFTLADPLAPLVFINGADSKAAQIFTLAHELAHIWLGKSSLSNPKYGNKNAANRIEKWCNSVAAELLVPAAELTAKLKENEELPETKRRLAAEFRVSKLVILLRLRDTHAINQQEFYNAWKNELTELAKKEKNRNKPIAAFYPTTIKRVSRRFATDLAISTLEGQTLYSDAYRLLGLHGKTFDTIVKKLEVGD